MSGVRPEPMYRFVQAYSACIGYGPGLEVRERGDDTLLGYVRRIEPSSPTARVSWMVYDHEGDEVGIADRRHAAANFLRARMADTLADTQPPTR